ncbi:MAG: hypothetical protein R3A46_09760 [Thermomicrobiales bacterium]
MTLGVNEVRAAARFPDALVFLHPDITDFVRQPAQVVPHIAVQLLAMIW